MTGDLGDSDDRRRADLSTDALFGLLADAARRIVLFHLRQHGSATTDELVDVLAEVDEYDPETIDSEHIDTTLREVHLPELAEHGLVTYDEGDDVVEVVALPPEVGEWLDLAVRRDLRMDTDASSGKRPGDDRPIRVLIVDDEPGLADTVATYVEHADEAIEATTATSALEATTVLEGESFDCVVSDYKMPAISGLDFLKVVREEYASLPFILFTAKGSEDAASEAIATGVTAYVTKGPDADQYDELVDHIHEAVDER
jgi:CheY-like chemotaxis protein/DNA-binding transcriptional ArsR family regulator